MQNNQEIRLWAKLKKKDKIVRDCVFACPPSQALSEGLIEACRHFDVAVPVVLGKHKRDMEQFHMVSFFPRDFVESFAYTALEISLIFPKNEHSERKPNPFSL